MVPRFQQHASSIPSFFSLFLSSPESLFGEQTQFATIAIPDAGHIRKFSCKMPLPCISIPAPTAELFFQFVINLMPPPPPFTAICSRAGTSFTLRALRPLLFCRDCDLASIAFSLNSLICSLLCFATLFLLPCEGALVQYLVPYRCNLEANLQHRELDVHDLFRVRFWLDIPSTWYFLGRVDPDC